MGIVASSLLMAFLVGAVDAAEADSSILETAAAFSSQGPPPKAEKPMPLEETLHGVKIVDDYRWLEDGENLGDAKVGRRRDGLHSRRARSIAGTRCDS